MKSSLTGVHIPLQVWGTVPRTQGMLDKGVYRKVVVRTKEVPVENEKLVPPDKI